MQHHFSNEDINQVLDVVTETTLASFWDWKIQEDTQFISPKFKKILGYENTELPNTHETWKSLIHPEDLPRALESIEKHISSKGVHPFREYIRYRRKDHAVIWVICSGRVINWGPKGNPLRMIGTSVDITELKEQTAQIKKNQKRFEILHEAIHAGIWDWNILNGKLYCSDRFYEILGYAPKEIPQLYNEVEKLIHPDDLSWVRHALAEHLNDKLPFSHTFRLRHKNGSYHWVESRGNAIRDETEQPLRMIGSIIDVDEAQKSRIELKRSNFLLRETARIAKCGGWEYDFHSKTIYWSNAVRLIHEVDPSFNPTLLNIIRFSLHEDYPFIKLEMTKCFQTKSSFEIEIPIYTAKQNKRWVRIYAKMITDDAGNPILLRGIYHDITHFREQQQELKSTIQALKAHNDRLQEFAHIVSHNMRSHTGNLNILCSLSKNEPDLLEKDKIQKMIENTASKLNATIEEIIQVIQVQAFDPEERRQCGLLDSFNNALHSLSSEIQKSPCRITHDFSESPSILFDKKFLDSIFVNLISNAIRYKHPQRNLTLHIESSQPEKGKQLIKFQDNGIGIDLKRHGKKVFGLYNTFHGNPDAHGVGLYLVKNQLQALGANIRIESIPNMGSSLIIEISSS